MADSFTETSSNSWFSRILSSFAGVLIGLILIPGAVILLSWNESRSVVTERSLKEGAAAVVEVSPDAIDPANNGKLIHVTGEATAPEKISDSLFGLTVSALRLDRNVEAYQWEEKESTEEKQKLGGGSETVTTYSYQKTWSGRLIDSDGFRHPEGHQNPTGLLAESRNSLAPDVTLGVFKVPANMVDDLPGAEPLELRAEDVDGLSAELRDSGARVSGGRFYFGKDPASPAVGDQRVAFEVVKPGTFSVLARQSAGSFAPFKTKAGDAIERVEAGSVEASEMFARAAAENAFLTWALRFVGFVLMAIGFACVFKPLGVIVSVLPFLGNLVGLGTGALAFALAVVGSLLTIAIAWIAVRPVFGVSLLILAGAVIFLAGRFAATVAKRKAAS